ncbi:MAG: putative zinc metalloprotease Rip3 [Planctomycetota bacterium]
MLLNASIPVGRVLGIRVRVHVLLLALMALVVFLQVAGAEGWAAAGIAALTISGLFAIVLLHELGHCLVARRHGIGVVDITLWPLGGMARMSAIPESPGIEARIAVAGPAVNLALFVLALPLALLDGRVLALPALASELLRWFLAANLVMALFNLLPAFPMDGGRILRAWFARRQGWLAATERAVKLGRWIAFLLLALGLMGVPGRLGPQFSLVLVAIFIWWSGLQELMLVRARHQPHPLQRIFQLIAARREAAREAARHQQAREATLIDAEVIEDRDSGKRT